MTSFKATVKMEKEGELTLHSLPFHSGEEVQVTVEPTGSEPVSKDRFPLRDTPYRYDAPFEPAVSAKDWDAQR